MDFYEVFERVVDLLRRQGRVSYRALKRQFALDDDYLEDLKAELIAAKRLAVDEQGTVLVWIGEATTPAPPDQDQGRAPLASADTRTAQPPISAPDQSATLHGQPDSQPAPAVPRAAEPLAPTAERRQLTVLFCDLVDSTHLARRFDPEDWREIVRAYQEACATVIQRFDGYIAQYLGDGLLVYFGYPQAHEDDARRAVHTGLAMLEAMRQLNIRLEQERGVQLTVRVGIHTGLVVVGEMGGGGRHERLALGDTPNLAARLQGVAEPDTVVMSADTLRLVEGYVRCKDLGPQAFKGVDTPVSVYRVLGEGTAQNRLEVTAARGWTPLVGREAEVALLRERWSQVTEGLGQVILVQGEAGIGKSRLVQVLKEHVAEASHTALECRGSPYHQHSALYPVIDLLQRAWQLAPGETPAEHLRKLEMALAHARLPVTETVPLLAALLSLPLPPDRYAPLSLTPQQQKQKTLEALLALLLELAAQQPVLLIVEDLHWIDPSALEGLSLLLDQVPTTRIGLLLTARPDFAVPWSARAYFAQLTLGGFARPQVRQMVEGVTGGKRLPAEVVQQIVAKADGVPLFVEELTKAVLEAGWLQEQEGHYDMTGPLPPLAIPATLQDALMARLDRLAEGKAVAQLGAVLGRTITHELLQAVAPVDELAVWRGLVQLVKAEVLYQHGVPPQATYTFKHALLQDAAYQSLLRSTRQQIHQRTAQVLVEQFPDLVETQPELLAQHYTEAGLGELAVGYWQRAGERSSARSAYVEAVAQLTTGLEVLKTLPDTPERTQRELALYTALGGPLQVTKGWASPEVEHVYTRARELCRQVGDTPQLWAVLGGLATFYQNRGELQTAREFQEQRLALAQHQHDAARLMGVHASLESILYNLGEFPLARAHFEQSLALDEPHQHRLVVPTADLIVNCLSIGANVLQLLGYPEQGLARLHAALKRARELAHPFTLVYAHFQAADFHRLRREGQAAQRHAEAVVALASEHGFAQRLAQGIVQRGWALAEQRRVAEGIAQMRQGLAALQSTGAKQGVPGRLGLLAEAHGKEGQIEEGLRVVAEALTMLDNNGERRRESELYCLKGELLLLQVAGRQEVPSTPLAIAVGAEATWGGATLASPLHIEAEACFQQALTVARRQQAKSLELRAALSLSRLWQRQGKRAAARALLAPTYGWFTEGFDTPDLKEAKALLDELA
jgi:class 3 adenylate cyclase/predicted ATPase